MGAVREGGRAGHLAVAVLVGRRMQFPFCSHRGDLYRGFHLAENEDLPHLVTCPQAAAKSSPQRSLRPRPPGQSSQNSSKPFMTRFQRTPWTPPGPLGTSPTEILTKISLWAIAPKTKDRG